MVLFIPSADTTGKNRYHCLPLISPRKFLDPSFHLSDFPGGLDGKESACNVGDLGSIPRLGRSPGEGNGLPTPVFWPGEFHGLYNPWDHKESDTTE